MEDLNCDTGGACAAPRMCVILARASDGGIGCAEGLPWHIPEELSWFRKRTMGHPLVMGRRTFESVVAQMGKPFGGRDNLVVSRAGRVDPAAHAGVLFFPDLEEALEEAARLARARGCRAFFVIGGAEIFRQTFARADCIYLTRIHAPCVRTPEAWIPESWFDGWHVAERESCDLMEKLSGERVRCDFETLVRTGAHENLMGKTN